MNQLPASASKSKPFALWALALGVFGVGVTEFVPVGLLPHIAVDFDVTVPIAGWVVTSYAVGVLVGAPLMTMLGVRVPRRLMLVLLMVVFTVGNVVTAIAPTFDAVVVGRVVTSFAHGAFFGIGSIVAAELAGPTRRSAAVAFMFSGLAVANLVGVPLGTWLGDGAGWRATFVAIALLGVATIVALAVLVPHLPRAAGANLRREFRALGNVQVVLALLMTLLGFGGVFAALTYLAPMMTEVAGFAEGSMWWILVVLGVGMVIGNWLGGRLADRALMATVLGGLVALALSLVAFAYALQIPALAVGNVFLLGLFGMATIPPLQTVVLDRAAAAPTLASAINIGAFNLGNAVAAWLGGLTISAGLGYASANIMGALMTSVGVALAIIAIAVRRRARTSR